MKSFNKESIQKNMDRLAKCFPHLTQHPFTYTWSVKNAGELEFTHKEKNIFFEIASLYDELAYPNHPNWDYCIPIIPNYRHNDKIIDIGFHMDDESILSDISPRNIINYISNNIVYSNNGPDYRSNQISISSVPSKKIMYKLYKLKILKYEDLFLGLDFNNFITKFYNSNLTGFDLQNLIENERRNDG